ncbi:MAG: hypothetical protein ACOC42_03300 [Halobacteriota archaeon]
MDLLPPINENDLDLVVSYSVGEEETVLEAVINAFQSANIEVAEESTRLHDWVNTDAVRSFHWTDRPLYVSTRIWDKRVVITAENVRIYAPLDLSSVR